MRSGAARPPWAARGGVLSRAHTRKGSGRSLRPCIGPPIAPSRRVIITSGALTIGHVDDQRRRGLRPFLLGGLLGSIAGIAAAGRMKVKAQPRKRETPAGLAAFEEAPCYQELVDREARGENRR
jgi:hypothetical protein